jgi:hypothetical protein
LNHPLENKEYYYLINNIIIIHINIKYILINNIIIINIKYIRTTCMYLIILTK